VRKRFGDERRTQIVDLSDDIGKEDLIAVEPMVVTLTRGGYIKRTPAAAYRAQARGGRGATAQKTKDEDVNSLLLVGSTHDYLLFFTDRGRVYREKIYDLPEADRAARGSHVRNLLPLVGDERVQTVLSIQRLDQAGTFVFATRDGVVKRTEIAEYANMNVAGLIALNLQDGDELVAVRISDGAGDVVLATAHGQAIRFPESEVRETGRATQGVIGIRLRRGDRVVSLAGRRRPRAARRQAMPAACSCWRSASAASASARRWPSTRARAAAARASSRCASPRRPASS
jgi:DNA gyrase subunit A